MEQSELSIRLLPKPSIRAYIAEAIRPVQRTVLYAINHRWRTLGIFTLLYAVGSFTIVPKIYQRSVLSVSEMTTKSTLVSFIHTNPTSVPTQTILPTPTPLDITPAWFIVPKLQIDTTIEHVGQTETLEMDIPKTAAHVAWYLYGPKPGEEGNVVINGHYDTPSGKPAVFYSLNKLVKGDEITIISVDGVETVYTVTEKKLYKLDEFPDEYVFHTREGKNLNIITCAGIWNTESNIYNERLVIYTSLKEG